MDSPTEEHEPAGVLDQLIAATQDAVVFIDANARIVRFNRSAQRIFGYTADEVHGRNVNVLMDAPHAERHDGYIRHYEKTGEARAIGSIRKIEGRRKDGTLFPVELSVTELRSHDVRYAAFIRDVSAQEDLEAELVDRERLAAVGTTAATFAHEIGNPLNSMYVNAQLIERRIARLGAAGESLSPRMSQLTAQIRRLGSLLDEFRALSRRQRFDVTSVDLGDLLRELVDADSAAREQAKVSITVDAPEYLAIDGDRAKLAQVLVNLMKNAVEAMPEGGDIHLSVREKDGEVTIAIADTGVGIPDAVDVFEPFLSTKENGTGLGLAVVKQIITGHGGSVSHASHRGRGTTFTVLLPVGHG
jgi:two-component system sensor kinase FixL